jgi:hypothetical protein
MAQIDSAQCDAVHGCDLLSTLVGIKVVQWLLACSLLVISAVAAHQLVDASKIKGVRYNY